MPDDQCSLNKLIFNSTTHKKSAYTTGEVANILSVSKNMVIVMCDEWEPALSRGLESYRVGLHRRIPHHALLEWLVTSSKNRL